MSGLYNLGSGYWYWDFSPLEKRINIMQNLLRHFVICPNKICIADMVKTKIHKNFKHKVTINQDRITKQTLCFAITTKSFVGRGEHAHG